jgi:hypothetical protein
MQTLDDHITRVRSFEDAQRAARPTTGVCWSGMPSPAPARSEAEIVRAGTAAYERSQKLATEPRFVLVGLLVEIQGLGNAGWSAAAERVREANSRGFIKADGSPNVDAIARALKLLNPIPGMAAVAAREILADMLILKLDRAA